MYVNRGMERVTENVCRCIQWEKGITPYVYVHTYTLFSCFCLMVSCFICRNLTLPSFKEAVLVRNGYFASFKKGVFVRNGYFAPMKSISVAMK